MVLVGSKIAPQRTWLPLIFHIISVMESAHPPVFTQADSLQLLSRVQVTLLLSLLFQTTTVGLGGGAREGTCICLQADSQQFPCWTQVLFFACCCFCRLNCDCESVLILWFFRTTCVVHLYLAVLSCACLSNLHNLDALFLRPLLSCGCVHLIGEAVMLLGMTLLGGKTQLLQKAEWEWECRRRQSGSLGRPKNSSSSSSRS